MASDASIHGTLTGRLEGQKWSVRPRGRSKERRPRQEWAGNAGGRWSVLFSGVGSISFGIRQNLGPSQGERRRKRSCFSLGYGV